MWYDRLRATRISRGLTLQKTADLIGIPLRTLQNYEAGIRQIPYSVLVDLADLFYVPTDFILERDEYLKALGVSVDVSLSVPPRRPKPQTNR